MAGFMRSPFRYLWVQTCAGDERLRIESVSPQVKAGRRLDAAPLHELKRSSAYLTRRTPDWN